MTSFNHYALGSVANFLHYYVGGISPLEPGWKRISIRPQPGGSITHARVTHLSPYGMIECSWKIVDGELKVRVLVPPNCIAVVHLPGLKEVIGSGQRDFSVPWVADPDWPPVWDKGWKYNKLKDPELVL